MKYTSMWVKLKKAVDIYTRYYIDRQPPIVIYSTGRVGSMALEWSLQTRNVLTFSVHQLSKVKANPLWLKAGSEFWVYHTLIRRKVPLKLISIVRDPIAMMITQYFPKLRWMAGDENAAVNLHMDELIDRFNNQYFEQGRHRKLLNWFDDEMKAVTGLDVYHHPSPADQGFVRFSANPFDVLLYHLEIDDALKSRIVGEFVGLPDFSLSRRNVSEQKRFGANYKAFKERVRLSAVRLDEVYESRYARHFYSEADRETMRRRWGG